MKVKLFSTVTTLHMEMAENAGLGSWLKAMQTGQQETAEGWGRPLLLAAAAPTGARFMQGRQSLLE
jgi:hypothetical protein